MSTAIDRAGVFRATIQAYSLREEKSGAKGIAVESAMISEAWNSETQAWEDWSQYDVDAEGVLYVVKKDGTVNQGTAESLIKYAGWNGDLEAVYAGTWIPTPCQIVVNEEKPNDYHEKSRYRISFVNAFDSTPGKMGNVSAERAKELQNQYGAQFRALAGNNQRNAKAPAGKPTLPPPAATPPVAPRSVGEAMKQFDAAVAPSDEKDDGVPF
jgi:hypothetical protein